VGGDAQEMNFPSKEKKKRQSLYSCASPTPIASGNVNV